MRRPRSCEARAAASPRPRRGVRSTAPQSGYPRCLAPLDACKHGAVGAKFGLTGVPRLSRKKGWPNRRHRLTPEREMTAAEVMSHHFPPMQLQR